MNIEIQQQNCDTNSCSYNNFNCNITLLLTTTYNKKRWGNVNYLFAYCIISFFTSLCFFYFVVVFCCASF